MRKAQADSPAKEKLLEAAEELMLAKGFVATTVDEICETAGLTKGGFFHYFESKEDLGKEVLNRFCHSMFQRFQQGPFQKEQDPLLRIYGWIDFAIEMSKNPIAQKGCLLGNFSQELADTHPGIRSLCAERFAGWAEFLKKELDEAKTRYVPGSRVDTQSLAEHFIAVIEGSLILAKAKQDMSVMEKSLRHLRSYVEGLFEEQHRVSGSK